MNLKDNNVKLEANNDKNYPHNKKMKRGFLPLKTS
jgi:hypothetical protein